MESAPIREGLLLFSQIIAFILVMVVFEAYRPARPTLSALESLLICLALAAGLRLLARLVVRRLLARLRGPYPPPDPGGRARRLVALLHGAAVATLVLMITLGQLKAHLVTLPGMGHSDTLLGLGAVLIYFLLLIQVWAASHPLEQEVMGHDLSRNDYVRGQARFVAPVAFPWLGVTLLRDLLALLWPAANAWLDTTAGELVFLGGVALGLALFFPPLVRTWWGCRPWPQGPVRELCQEVLRLCRVRVNEVLDWPILDGKMLTAGLLGVAPRLRYLLITPALAQALSPSELAGVVAHEAGHARHRHIPIFLLLFLGFFLAAFAMSEPISLGLTGLAWWLAGSDWGASLLTSPGAASSWFSLLVALPLLAFLVFYLRLVMGFFMRHFERQADYFSLNFLASAAPLVGALEKIARIAGNIREAPSWHHFSVAQRVRALVEAQERPALVREHRAMLRRAAGIYAAGLALCLVVGWGVGASGLEESLHARLMIRLMERQLARNPHHAGLQMSLGILLFEQGNEHRAKDHLALAVRLAPRNPEALNSLAWFWVSAKDPNLRRPVQGLRMALQAVTLRPAPHIFDTLAEAYFANQQWERALAASRAALAAGPKNRLDYYRAQLERFTKAAREKSPAPKGGT